MRDILVFVLGGMTGATLGVFALSALILGRRADDLRALEECGLDHPLVPTQEEIIHGQHDHKGDRR